MRDAYVLKHLLACWWVDAARNAGERLVYAALSY
jgi:hypothetical protein